MMPANVRRNRAAANPVGIQNQRQRRLQLTDFLGRMMTEKIYDLKLLIDCDSVRVSSPSGHYWSYKEGELPEWIHALASQCLKDDASLCQSIQSRLKPMKVAE